jgi:hypothetical protein
MKIELHVARLQGVWKFRLVQINVQLVPGVGLVGLSSTALVWNILTKSGTPKET